MQPVSRVSRHEDTDGDGVYDKHTVFADKLLLPRIMLPLDDRIIIGETNTDDLYIYRDSNGDGVADEKTLWFKGGPRGGNMEHQPNGLVWAMDNGIYSTYYDYRLRFGADGKAVKETIPVNGGQWGLTQDDWGKVWFVNAGNETGPVHFQQHIIYGQFSAPNELIGQYKIVWPIARVPDTQGGPGQLRPDNTLNHFTATSGQDIFRGDRLPADLRGNLLFAEPVGRLIRRTLITVDDGVTRLANRLRRSARRIHPRDRSAVPPRQHDHRARRHSLYRRHVSRHHPAGQLDAERLATCASRSRPTSCRRRSAAAASIACVTRVSSAARSRTCSTKLRPSGCSTCRIPMAGGATPRRSFSSCVAICSVVPALEKLASGDSADPRPRLHALWTLDGLGALDDKLILRALKSTDPQVRIAGLRLAELRVNAKSAATRAAGRRHARRAAGRRSARRHPGHAVGASRRVARCARKSIKATAETSTSAGVYAINEQLWDEANNEDPQLIRLLGVNGLKSYRAGRTLYSSVCFACHGTDGHGAPKPGAEGRTIAPSLAGSPRVLGDERATIAIVLHGLQGNVDGVDYGAPMVPMNSYSDAELAGVLTYIRNSFGNRAPAVEPAAVAARRAADAARTNYWTLAELTGQIPALGVPRKRFERRAEWKLAANMEARANSPLEAMLDGDPKTGYYHRGRQALPDGVAHGRAARAQQDRRHRHRFQRREGPGRQGHGLGAGLQRRGVRRRQDLDHGRRRTSMGEPHARLNLAAPVEARHLRIAITEKEGWQPWVIKELNLYGEER